VGSKKKRKDSTEPHRRRMGRGHSFLKIGNATSVVREREINGGRGGA